MGEASKKKQFVESYEDYLLSKQSKNNCIFYKILLNSKQNIEALFFLVFLFFSSCQYFEKQVPSEGIIEKRVESNQLERS
jgi:hypothetical protein